MFNLKFLLMEKQKTSKESKCRMKGRLLFAVVLLLLFLSVPLKGYSEEKALPDVVQQNTVTVTGTVKDANGEPIIGAKCNGDRFCYRSNYRFGW